MLLRYFLNEYQVVPFSPIITGITFVFTFHRWIYILRSLYFKAFSPPFLIAFFSPEIVKLQSPLSVVSLFVITHFCPVYCYRRFCQFSLVNVIVCLRYFHILFILILLHAYTIVPCLILPQCPCF
jgi:hypothetical protein